MAGFSIGYSDACLAFLMGNQSYRTLFFPQTSKTWDMAEQRLDQLAGYTLSNKNTEQELGIDWDLYCKTQTWKPLTNLNLVQHVAAITAVPLAAWLSRYYGRRLGVLVGNLLLVVGVLLKAFAWQFPQLVVGNLLEGAGKIIIWLVRAWS